MRRLLSLLLASTMILVACGNANNENKKKEDEKSEVKEAKKNNDKPKNEKKNQDINKTIMSKFKMSIINNQS